LPAVSLLLVACSSEPPRPAVEQPKQSLARPEPVSAQYAFHLMYVAARNWAQDAQPLRLSNITLPEFHTLKGKADAWQATFVSPQSGRAKTFTYSVIEGPSNLHKGLFQGPEESWGGRQDLPFSVYAFKVDASAALEKALKPGADYAKKHPAMPINFLLERTARFPYPVWRVYWGESVGASGYSILIDAVTGDHLQTLR
jgi:hypothetical protein